jgi:chromosomal replication initiation ATPase DnaA
MWQTALAELEQQMTGPAFETWIRPATLLSWESKSNGSGSPRTHVAIGAPNAYIRDWLENRLITPIRRTLSGVAGNAVEVRFEVCKQ